MPHLSEVHGAATHLAVVGIPLYALLLVLRRLERGGDAARVWEPWVLGAAAVGVAASGVTGLLVRGESQTQLRGADYDVGGIHFWLGIGVAAGVLALAGLRRRAGAAGVVVAVLALVAVLAQGYFGGRMTYEHGVGVEALGEGAQTARGTAALETALAAGMPPEQAGEDAFNRTGLGCASCHGDQAQGARGPDLAGGRDLSDFRAVHGTGLFPPSTVSDRDFAAINAWLRTLRSVRR
ncbi:MAG: hypothetical protein QOF76_5452 [Solirubrobacteraceae bacterium]|jgi:cytochrome c553|nr:hypothetical protein [Solirubrobacteraceae bacterium]